MFLLVVRKAENNSAQLWGLVVAAAGRKHGKKLKADLVEYIE